DGDTLGFSADGLPTGLSISGAGVISGTIGFDAAAGSPYTVTVTANDGNGGTVDDSFSWSVSDVDQGDAVANDDAATVLEDSGTTAIDVLANDVADPDDGLLQVTAAGVATNGTTAFTAGGVSYTPDADYCGDDGFTYTINGGDTATVSVTVECVNDAPVAVGTPPDLIVVEGDAVDVEMAGYFDDIDGDTLSYAASNLPAGLSIDPVTGRITGTVSFGASVDGPYSVEVVASDPDDASALQTFAISVASAGEPGGDIFKDGFEGSD
ncbi:MAG TPA: putative Ig domain-containing protein, partial [Xanthomonadaceae bacterium]|nr:putative Ig domain-containing protein [Xanthomonadaceae bacterium]